MQRLINYEMGLITAAFFKKEVSKTNSFRNGKLKYLLVYGPARRNHGENVFVPIYAGLNERGPAGGKFPGGGGESLPEGVRVRGPEARDAVGFA